MTKTVYNFDRRQFIGGSDARTIMGKDEKALLHLWKEKRVFLLFVAIFTISVLLGMQYGWTDSSRMVVGAPFSSTNK